jgi:hypothetical protein
MLACESPFIIHIVFPFDVTLPVLRDKASLNKIRDYETHIRKMDNCVSTGNLNLGQRIAAIK